MTPAAGGRDGDWLLLHNPGSKRASRTRERAEGPIAELSVLDRRVVWWVSIEELDRVEWLPERLIAMGGDGTVNAAASWIASPSSEPRSRDRARPTLAIIPAGTGNNLARDFGIPLDTHNAVALAFADARGDTIDLLRFDDLDNATTHYAVQSGSLGFPATVARRYHYLRRYRALRALMAPLGQYVYRVIGMAGLVDQAIRQALGRGTLRVQLELADESIDTECLAIFVNNERSMGGNFFPCPDADPADGKLDLCILTTGPVRRYPGLFRAVCRADHVDRYAEVVTRQSDASIELTLDRPSPLMIDGDLLGSPTRLRAEVLPAYLSVVKP